MTTIQKDLNLFASYKKGPGKESSKDLKMLLLTVLCFIMIVLGAYGALFIYEASLNNKTNMIRQELALPQTVETQNRINTLATKNRLLNSYYSSISKAKNNFSASRVIDSKLFNIVSNAMPATVKLQSITITPQSIELSCTCSNTLDPAVFSNSLKKEKIFTNVSYGGFTSKDEKSFTFNISCFLGEN